MAKELSVIHSSLSGGQMVGQRLQLDRGDVTRAAMGELRALGISFNPAHVAAMVDGYTRDAADVGYGSPLPGLSSPQIATPIQFLQEWLPGFVNFITAARKIDELVGLATIGAWEDEEVIQGTLETTGSAVPYSDYGNIPFTSWNPAYEGRTIVRFEQGFRVGRLEEARSARARINSGAEKRGAVAQQLEIIRNRVGFYGYNDGTNRTFGFLNDPNLLPAKTAANGQSGSPAWSGKTFLEITADIQAAMAQLQMQSMDNIDPASVDVVMGLPTPVNQYLTTVSDMGVSVRQWMRENYPKLRVVTAPELIEAVGGVNVAYFYVEEVDDASSDDKKVFIQMVPTKFMSLGVEKAVKSYEEDFANATAGVMLKRPYAVVRLLGV